jgi:hypothetical protein
VTKWGLAAATAALCAVLALLAACGGGGDDDDNGDETPTATRASGTRTGTATSGTPGASGTGAADGSPGAGGTAAAQSTPAPGTTAAAQATTQSETGATPGSGEDPGSGPAIEGAPTPTDAERQLNSGEGIDPEQSGGNIDDPPRIVTDLPDPPAGASIDPNTIADPNVSTGGIEFIIDTNASQPGIQSSRDINVGDVINVAIVTTNVPGTGLSSFNFVLDYDITKIVAPTINGGSSLARNPNANESGLGLTSGWVCSPPGPEGDRDEPGLVSGDGDPATGEAFISCYSTAAPSAMGTVVLATVQFQAVASGTTTLSLSETQTSEGSFNALAGCDLEPIVPCRTATITVN